MSPIWTQSSFFVGWPMLTPAHVVGPVWWNFYPSRLNMWRHTSAWFPCVPLLPVLLLRTGTGIGTRTLPVFADLELHQGIVLCAKVMTMSTTGISLKYMRCIICGFVCRWSFCSTHLCVDLLVLWLFYLQDSYHWFMILKRHLPEALWSCNTHSLLAIFELCLLMDVPCVLCPQADGNIGCAVYWVFWVRVSVFPSGSTPK